MKKKLFITGAAGKVGSGLRRHLKDRYDFRLLFHRNIPPVEPNEEIVVSDLANFENMVEACEGIDTIVHLGIAIVQRGYPRTRYNQMIMETNIQGTYNIFEAARINKVPVVVFASTNHVNRLLRERRHLHHSGHADPPRQHVRRQQGLRRSPRPLLLRRVRHLRLLPSHRQLPGHRRKSTAPFPPAKTAGSAPAMSPS